MPIRTVLFDLDDTLLVEGRSVQESFMAAARVVKARYHSVAEDAFTESMRRCARELWYSQPTIDYCLSIGISSWEGLWAEFSGEDPSLKMLEQIKDYYQTYSWLHALRDFGIDDMDLAQELSEVYKKERDKRHILFPDVIQCLENLRLEYKLALITNGTQDLQQKKINRGNLDRYFQFVAISAKIGYAKPAREIFSAALQALKSSKDEAVMVGDSLKTDIKGANDSGILSIWLNRERDTNTTGIPPVLEISSLAELPPLLQKIY